MNCHFQEFMSWSLKEKKVLGWNFHAGFLGLITPLLSTWRYQLFLHSMSMKHWVTSKWISLHNQEWQLKGQEFSKSVPEKTYSSGYQKPARVAELFGLASRNLVWRITALLCQAAPSKNQTVQPDITTIRFTVTIYLFMYFSLKGSPYRVYCMFDSCLQETCRLTVSLQCNIQKVITGF